MRWLSVWAMMIGPRFKAELSHSRYALVNILLIVGAKKDIKILVVLWLLGRVYTYSVVVVLFSVKIEAK